MKEFFHFNNGYRISDAEINSWINQVIYGIESGKDYHSIASGDTSVIGLRWDSEIEVIVANSSGKSVVRFSTYPGCEDKLEFSYSRPS
jgi:hypothetical protein